MARPGATRRDPARGPSPPIERGLGARAPLETWVALGAALDRPLAVTLSRPLGPGRDEPADAGHLAIQEHVLALALARATGRSGTFELPTRPPDPSRSTDVGIRDPRHRVRILAECWNTVGDLGSAMRATNRKHAEAAATWPEDRIATVWVVRATAANRALLARSPHILRTLPGLQPPPAPRAHPPRYRTAPKRAIVWLTPRRAG